MPVSLRKRLYCHYCGKKSNQTNLRRFQCEHCLAVNYLDENGEITDPPAEVTGTSAQYARLAPVASNSIFCNTCLKNQDILARLIADYIPDEDDPNYHAAVAGLGAFRERIEQDYPQCCALCEPRAQAQLRAATKTAKSDNMLRNLQKTRLKRAGQSLEWRPLVITGAGFGYFASNFTQLLWHFFGAQGGSRPMFRSALQCLTGWPAPMKCQEEASALLPVAMFVGFACSWWNPKWRHKLEAREGRLVGLGEYYAIQVLVLVCRMVAWTVLTDFAIEARLRTMIHCISLIVLLILTVSGLFVVKLDSSPLINWEYQPPRLVSESQFAPPPAQEAPSFPVNNLAAPPQQHLRPWRPPTPPTENADAMDWTPSHSFKPRQLKPRDAGTSPFHGKLPTLSGGLRNQETKQSIGLPPGFFDKRDPLSAKGPPQLILAEPKFFPATVDTGLENMFGQVFSLADTGRHPAPANPGFAQVPSSRESYATPVARTPESTASTTSNIALFSAAMLFILLVAWLLSGHLLIAIPDLRVYVLGCAALVPAFRIINPVVIPSITFLGETVTIGALAAMVTTGENEAIVKLGAGALAFLVAQELFFLSQRPQSPSSSGKPTALLPQSPSQLAERPTGPNGSRPQAAMSPALGFDRKGSGDTMSSEASNSSTSTAPDWKTPKIARTSRRRESNFGMNGLRL